MSHPPEKAEALAGTRATTKKSATSNVTTSCPISSTFMRSRMEASGIPLDVAAQLGIRAVPTGFEIPYFDPSTGKPMLGSDGKPFRRLRLEHPKNGAKYLSGKGAGIRVYIPRLDPEHAALLDPERDLLVTEGELKAVASYLAGEPCIGLGGIWNWLESRDDREDGQDKLHRDLVPYLPPGRRVVMVYDSDATDPRKAETFNDCARRFARALTKRNCTLARVDLPSDGDSKVGLDDYLQEHDGMELRGLIEREAVSVSGAIDGVTFAELAAMDLPPVAWAVDGILPEGLSVLAGPPKSGKSFLALGLAMAVATGGRALGEFQCKGGPVLYLALEDGLRRLQDRLTMILDPGERPEAPITVWHADTAIPRDPDKLLAEMEAWADVHHGARLIVVDTLGRIKPVHARQAQMYEQEVQFLATLQRVARARHLCMLALHHTRKATADVDPFDSILGSQGQWGTYDTGWLLQRRHGEDTAVLHVSGRDSGPDQRLALEFGNGVWRFRGDAAEVLACETQKAILEALRDGDREMGVTELATVTGKGKSLVHHHLQKMLQSELVRVGGKGMYKCT